MLRVIYVYFWEVFILKKCYICQTWGGDPADKMSHFLALTRSSGSHSVLLSVPWSISSLSVVSVLTVDASAELQQQGHERQRGRGRNTDGGGHRVYGVPSLGDGDLIPGRQSLEAAAWFVV